MHESHFTHHHHDLSLVVISILIAAFASYTALDIVSVISANRKEVKKVWILGGALAMGIGIWSMHFVGMLAFQIPETQIFYDVPLMIASILISISASYFSLLIMSSPAPKTWHYFQGALGMGVAISGMHYIGIQGMRMPYDIVWNQQIVIYSILIAIGASFVALHLGFNLRGDISVKGYVSRGIAGLIMGGAISSMHYVGMAAMSFVPNPDKVISVTNGILATEGLAAATVIGSLVVLGLALIGSNIDRSLERKNLLNDLLQDTIKGRDEFLSIASHELRTPLTSLKLQIGMLERKIILEEMNQEKKLLMIQQCNKSIGQISKVIEEMLDMARISTGRISLEKEEFYLCKFLADLIERIRPTVSQSSTLISLDVKEEVLGTWDKFRIEQAITNIIMNAFLYAKSSNIRVRLWRFADRVNISIEDDGIGIAPHEHVKIFHRYERGESSKDNRGLGIGLYLVKEIISLHEG